MSTDIPGSGREPPELLAMDEAKAQFVADQQQRDASMARFKATLVDADRAGVPRTTIITRSELSPTTVYRTLREAKRP